MAKKPLFLLIDDDQETLNLTERLVTRNEVDVITALTGASGVDIAARSSCDAVVTDQNLGDSLGIELAQQIKEHRRSRLEKPPVMVLSSSDDCPSLRLQALKNGFDFVLAKPLTAKDIRTVTEACRSMATKE